MRAQVRALVAMLLLAAVLSGIALAVYAGIIVMAYVGFRNVPAGDIPADSVSAIR